MLPRAVYGFGIKEFQLKNQITIVIPCRLGHILRGKPPGIARSLEQRIKDENPVDLEISKKINIGFPQLRISRSQQLKERLAHVKAQRKNPELEKSARNFSLEIDLNEVKRESSKLSGQHQLRSIAEHYGIFEDLFGAAFFIPRVPLDITFEVSDSISHPVYNGNIIKPFDAVSEPKVAFNTENDLITGEKTKGDSYWTLILTNPDGHLSGENKEYAHWFISNIPNGNIKNGEVIASYLQPFPPRGLGYQRFIFVLYKQTKKLDFSEYKVEKLNDLEKRTFSTLDFYRKYQDDITPAGLAFFQSNWDRSVTDVYHNVLDMKEPVFEYDFPAPYITDQRWFPLRQPFNLYMDKYRDPKKINKEYLEKKLAKSHPFNGPEPELRYPNAHPIKDVPSWQRTEIRKNRLKLGRINDY